MSAVDAFDLAQRLRAATTGSPTPRAVFTPCLTPIDPVAVVLDRDAGEPVLHAATPTAAATGRGHHALAALYAVGVRLDDTHRTLVVPDLATLAALGMLAREAPGTRGGAHTEAAAVVAWWDQRGDHPGTSAVLPVTDTCALRWALGTTRRAEQHVQTWRTWLDVSSTGPQALLDLADRVAEGDPLPGLQDAYDTDARSWSRFRDDLDGGRDWRRPDSRTQAAFGLTTRSDATQLFESLRLRDPLVALRESYAGNVVTGRVAAIGKHTMLVESTQPVCRLRPGSDVQGWRGDAVAVPGANDNRIPKLTAALREVTVSAGRALALELGEISRHHGTITVGDMVTLRGRAVDPYQQQRARGFRGLHYRTAGNWMATRNAPRGGRRPVPLDVVIQAADD